MLACMQVMYASYGKKKICPNFFGGGAEQHINQTQKGVTIVGTKRVNF